ncbi:hypothetical protein LWI28_027127 [Acer negundo]|uniref:Uncharacterized protein n=1 Tax=Acer negundo TaxID=4023 RepID=A0AAD5JB39_ACENE|nr:hypothetical protein LWI28_027127 [Acer negundo]
MIPAFAPSRSLLCPPAPSSTSHSTHSTLAKIVARLAKGSDLLAPIDPTETTKEVLPNPHIHQSDQTNKVETSVEPVKEMETPVKPGVSGVEETLVDPEIARTKGG